MPAGRVLSSEQAKTAITQMRSIINGGLTNEINNLNTQGQALSDPNNWDGPLAERFRSSTWPETKSALDKAKDELDELRGQLHQHHDRGRRQLGLLLMGRAARPGPYGSGVLASTLPD